MEKNLFSESAKQRACKETDRFRKSTKSFWGVEIVGGAVLGAGGGYVGFLFLPIDATKEQAFLYPAVGAVIGVIVGFILVFSVILLVNLIRAPYNQRNEARGRVKKLEDSLGDFGYVEAFKWEAHEDIQKLRYDKSKNLPVDEHSLKRFKDWFSGVSEWMNKHMSSETVNWHHDVDIGLTPPTIDDVIKAYESGFNILKNIAKTIESVVRKEGFQH